MKKYIVVRYYGHYIRATLIEAQNEKTAFQTAIYGKEIYTEISRNFYGEGGFAKCIDDNADMETQIKWLIEAIELGFPANAEQHTVALGLPFVIPGVQYTTN